VVAQGNMRTPDKFVGKEAVITSQCLNGWWVGAFTCRTYSLSTLALYCLHIVHHTVYALNGLRV